MNSSSALWLRRAVCTLCSALLVCYAIAIVGFTSKLGPYPAVFDFARIFGLIFAFPVLTLLPWQHLPRRLALLGLPLWAALGVYLLVRNTASLLVRHSRFHHWPSIPALLVWSVLFLVFVLNLVWLRTIGILRFPASSRSNNPALSNP